MYLKKDLARGVDGTFMWLMEEVGELASALREGTHEQQLEEFADACAGGAAFRVRPEEAIHTVAVMQAMVASAKRGEAVTLNGAS
mgnify:CR=1 FL=1